MSIGRRILVTGLAVVLAMLSYEFNVLLFHDQDLAALLTLLVWLPVTLSIQNG